MPAQPTRAQTLAALTSGLPPVACEGALLEELRGLMLSLADGTALSMLDDHEVMTQLQASRLRLDLLQRPVPELLHLVSRTAAAPASPPPPAAAPRAAAPAPAPPPANDSTFEPGLDVAAQVAALVQAAQDGAPFCEECERARQTSTA